MTDRPDWLSLRNLADAKENDGEADAEETIASDGTQETEAEKTITSRRAQESAPGEGITGDAGRGNDVEETIANDGARREDFTEVITGDGAQENDPAPAASFDAGEISAVTPGGSASDGHMLDAPNVTPTDPPIFNEPNLCTDECNDDDLDPESAAKGGVYQGDGRIADSGLLVLEGGIRIGQAPARGSPLETPFDAEIHLAIAPHGKAQNGAALRRQLNGPIGNPTLWWGARFPAP